MKRIKEKMTYIAAGVVFAIAVTVYAAPPPAPQSAHPDYEKIAAPDGCLKCHGKDGVKPTPHPGRAACKQCHVKGAAAAGGAAAVANRAHKYAPPLAPVKIHPTFDKIKTPDGCLKCHGKDGAKPAPHPERHSCKQCHIPFITEDK